MWLNIYIPYRPVVQTRTDKKDTRKKLVSVYEWEIIQFVFDSRVEKCRSFEGIAPNNFY